MEIKSSMWLVFTRMSAVPQNIIGTVEVIKPLITDKDINAKFVEKIVNDKKVINLADAKIIVAGGRGVKNAEGFDLTKQLAEKLGAEVGASRAIVDSGEVSKYI